MIKFLKITSIILLFLSNSIVTFGQTKDEVLRLKPLFKTAKHKETYSFAKSPNNEIEFVFSGLYLTYKYFISSQDIDACVFHPSCSTYALLAIQKKGLIVGTLSAFDRLTRCNGLSPENYEIQKETYLFYDPID